MRISVNLKSVKTLVQVRSVLAKFEEVAERKIYNANCYFMSGHSLEHLYLALVPVLFSFMLMYQNMTVQRYLVFNFMSGHSLDNLCLALVPILFSFMLIYRNTTVQRYLVIALKLKKKKKEQIWDAGCDQPSFFHFCPLYTFWGQGRGQAVTLTLLHFWFPF